MSILDVNYQQQASQSYRMPTEVLICAEPSLQTMHSLEETVYKPQDEQQIWLLFPGIDVDAHWTRLKIKLLNFRGIYQLRYLGALQKP